MTHDIEDDESVIQTLSDEEQERQSVDAFTRLSAHLERFPETAKEWDKKR